MPEPLTYYAALDGLDATEARFGGYPHGVGASMPREAWEKAGKPGEIRVVMQGRD